MAFNIKKLTKKFGNLKVYNEFDLKIQENKITCILGPSGCGKTTLLKIISGIIPCDEGLLDDFSDIETSYLFQENSLLPWKNIGDNIGYVLKSKFKKEKVEEIVDHYLDLVDLKEFKEYYPNEISGGMNQRVSIARAFAFPSKLLLMDEPFNGLDVKLKNDLMELFIDLWLKEKRTVIYITHDLEEALALGDEIYVFSSMPVSVKKHIEIPLCKKRRIHKKCCTKNYKSQLYDGFSIMR
jgi:NitT/TauT family transport system ATP-binding protein